MPKSWFNIASNGDVAEVSIDGRIGEFGVSSAYFNYQLNAISAGTINLRLNSIGGELFDGLSIYDALKTHSAQVNIRVTGIAASVGSVIAMAGDHVCMAPYAFMMIHNVRPADDVAAKLSEKIAQAYADKTGKPVDQIKKLMDAESWFDAEEAKAFGLADEIDAYDSDEDEDEEEMTMAAFQACLKFNNTPNKLRKYAASLVKEKKMSALNTYSRDGKTFIKIGDAEHEVVVTAAAPVVAPVVAPATASAADQAKAIADAVAAERQYRADFDTAVATAGITGKALDEFKKFYGRSMDDIKFLASHAIAARTKPVGEGGGGAGGEDAAVAKDKVVVDVATKRFAEDRNLRQMFGVATSDATNDGYKAALTRYIVREKQAAADGMNPLTNEELDAKYGKRSR